MKTIEERAKQAYQDDDDYGLDYATDMLRKGYIKGATDQDKISREDERKKVIEKALKYLHKTYELHLMPTFDEDLIKAIEE